MYTASSTVLCSCCAACEVGLLHTEMSCSSPAITSSLHPYLPFVQPTHIALITGQLSSTPAMMLQLCTLRTAVICIGCTVQSSYTRHLCAVSFDNQKCLDEQQSSPMDVAFPSSSILPQSPRAASDALCCVNASHSTTVVCVGWSPR